MPKEFQKFVVSQKGMIMRGGKCLIMQLNHEPDHFDYQKWDMPGGRIDEGEDGDVSFKRELKEETGLSKFKDLGIAGCFIRYPHNELPPYCGLLRLLEIGDEDIKLSFEHCEMKWIGKEEVDDYAFCWKKMPEMIKKGFELYEKIK